MRVGVMGSHVAGTRDGPWSWPHVQCCSFRPEQNPRGRGLCQAEIQGMTSILATYVVPGAGDRKSLPLPISSIFTVSTEIPSERDIQPQSSSHIQELKQSYSFCSITQDTLPPGGFAYPTGGGGSAAVNPSLLTLAVGSLCKKSTLTYGVSQGL